jgi:hypothetical protein
MSPVRMCLRLECLQFECASGWNVSSSNILPVAICLQFECASGWILSPVRMCLRLECLQFEYTSGCYMSPVRMCLRLDFVSRSNVPQVGMWPDMISDSASPHKATSTFEHFRHKSRPFMRSNRTVETGVEIVLNQYNTRWRFTTSVLLASPVFSAFFSVLHVIERNLDADV